MTALLAERAAEVVSAAQQLLSKRMGAPVKLSDPIGPDDDIYVFQALTGG